MKKIPGVNRTPFEGYWIDPKTWYCYSFDMSIADRYDAFWQLLIQQRENGEGRFTTFSVDEDYLFIDKTRYAIVEFTDKRAVLMPDIGDPLVLIKRRYDE